MPWGRGKAAAASSPTGTRAAAGARSPGGRRLGRWAGPSAGLRPSRRARDFLFLFLNNFAEPKKNHRKINKNPKMPKQIFTV